MQLKSKALALVARREHSRQELFEKLRTISDDVAQINQLLDDFERIGYISDKRYVDCFVHSKKAKYGKRRLAYLLQQKGVNSDIIEQSLHAVEVEDQVNIAYALIVKKYTIPLPDRATIAKAQKFLLYRGFDFDVIKRTISLVQST